MPKVCKTWILCLQILSTCVKSAGEMLWPFLYFPLYPKGMGSRLSDLAGLVQAWITNWIKTDWVVSQCYRYKANVVAGTPLNTIFFVYFLQRRVYYYYYCYVIYLCTPAVKYSLVNIRHSDPRGIIFTEIFWGNIFRHPFLNYTKILPFTYKIIQTQESQNTDHVIWPTYSENAKSAFHWSKSSTNSFTLHWRAGFPRSLQGRGGILYIHCSFCYHLGCDECTKWPVSSCLSMAFPAYWEDERAIDWHLLDFWHFSHSRSSLWKISAWCLGSADLHFLC